MQGMDSQARLKDLFRELFQLDAVVERDSEGYFVASVPALRGCHTQAKSPDELMVRIREAIDLCLEVRGLAG